MDQLRHLDQPTPWVGHRCPTCGRTRNSPITISCRTGHTETRMRRLSGPVAESPDIQIVA